MPQTLNEIRQALRAGQREQSAGSLQGMGGEIGQVRQQWAGIGRRKSDDGVQALRLHESMQAGHRRMISCMSTLVTSRYAIAAPL